MILFCQFTVMNSIIAFIFAFCKVKCYQDICSLLSEFLTWSWEFTKSFKFIFKNSVFMKLYLAFFPHWCQSLKNNFLQNMQIISPLRVWL